MKTLKLGSLNVCGLKRRSNFPEFISLIHDYDIFLVSESKLDQYDVIKIDGYTYINIPRKQKTLRKSGGIGAFVKNCIFPYIEVIETQCDYLMWLKLSCKFTNLDEDLIFGTVYVPPMTSRFYNNDQYEMFEHEISNICNKYSYVYLFGDHNAQTEEMVDFTVCDDFLADLFDFDYDTINFLDQKAAMEHYGIELNRKSQDKKKNNHGYKLIDNCKNNNLIILNGRYGKDSGTWWYR